ncbi:galactose oxidase-like domain-containing protein [Streptomyces boninensis]|uniref:galactose oxidase-like domain-containing protein n=1 Tax=Streptomyces boninensis TaxID=2039455 RepID=UPI003B216D8D
MRKRNLKKTVIGGGVIVLLAAMNAPATYGFAKEQYHDYVISRPEYKAKYGSWGLMDVPDGYRLNSIHAALLHTGKVLLVAGSGNKQEQFDAGEFKTVLWDPEKNTYKKIATPADMFCAGHAQLPSGNLLVAGGTARYEKLNGDVEKAGGRMVIKNEDPEKKHRLPKGTRFISPSGIEYRTAFPVDVPKAKKKSNGKKGKVTVKASEAKVFVEATDKGREAVNNRPAQYSVEGLKGKDLDNVYGLAQRMTLEKQDFQGIRDAFEFNPDTEKYERVEAMDAARWYPTLVTLANGKVMAVSGLDDIGEILQGDNEIYDPKTRKWTKGPKRYFPTYPALFLTKGGKLFYSGSNAGYGAADKGRVPGTWDVKKNKFTPVPGLTDKDETETSSSLLLPPAQDQKVMILGGGGVGESKKATPRTAVVDLMKKNPSFKKGPDLPQGTRYLNSVIMPDDSVFTTGGSRDYRGRSNSDLFKSQIYDPKKNRFTKAASPTVGRNYHSEAMLLPDGRVATFGSDPLYGNKANTVLGEFEKRIEVYEPPYLHDADGKVERLEIGKGPKKLERGASATFKVADAKKIKNARLMRPSAVTHVTDVEQRSIALDLTKKDDSVSFKVPEDTSLAPPGWYMLFVTDAKGVPSKAKWVKVD